MNPVTAPDPSTPRAKLHAVGTVGMRTAPIRNGLLRRSLPPLAVASAMAWSSAAMAVDGCLVLLCFAAPSWRSIPQCVPPIKQVLRDLARGRAFPRCAMAGAANTASHSWARAPGHCPPQYTRVVELESGKSYSCDYAGAVSVSINGAPFSRTWWSMAGDSVTEFTPAAKAQLGQWDTRFDRDLANWKASLPTTAPVIDAP